MYSLQQEYNSHKPAPDCRSQQTSVICDAIVVLHTPSRPRLGPFLWPALRSAPVPSTFRALFVAGLAFCPGPLHVSGGFCGRHCVLPRSRPRFRRFLWLAWRSAPVPSTFRAVFVAGTAFCPGPVHVQTRFCDWEHFASISYPTDKRQRFVVSSTGTRYPLRP